LETLDPRSADFGWLAQLMRWVGVLIYLAMAGQMLRYLLAPGPEDGEAILTLGVLMGFEFIVVHSGVFMAAMGRSKAILLFVPIYGLFAWVFNQFAPNNAVMWLYLSLVLPSPTRRNRASRAMGFSPLGQSQLIFSSL
jgi:hypothetical protein